MVGSTNDGQSIGYGPHHHRCFDMDGGRPCLLDACRRPSGSVNEASTNTGLECVTWRHHFARHHRFDGGQGFRLRDRHGCAVPWLAVDGLGHVCGRGLNGPAHGWL